MPYKLILFILDGGSFDLDGTANGTVVDPASILGTPQSDTPGGGGGGSGGAPRRGDGGCGNWPGLNVGFSFLALGLVPLLLIRRRK